VAKHYSTFADPPFGIVDPVELDHHYEPPLRGFVVAAGGNVSVVMFDGSTGVIPGCTPGTYYGGVITKITSAGTTASGIKGFL